MGKGKKKQEVIYETDENGITRAITTDTRSVSFKIPNGIANHDSTEHTDKNGNKYYDKKPIKCLRGLQMFLDKYTQLSSVFEDYIISEYKKHFGEMFSVISSEIVGEKENAVVRYWKQDMQFCDLPDTQKRDVFLWGFDHNIVYGDEKHGGTPTKIKQEQYKRRKEAGCMDGKMGAMALINGIAGGPLDKGNTSIFNNMICNCASTITCAYKRTKENMQKKPAGAIDLTDEEVIYDSMYTIYDIARYYGHIAGSSFEEFLHAMLDCDKGIDKFIKSMYSHRKGVMPMPNVEYRETKYNDKQMVAHCNEALHAPYKYNDDAYAVYDRKRVARKLVAECVSVYDMSFINPESEHITVARLYEMAMAKYNRTRDSYAKSISGLNNQDSVERMTAKMNSTLGEMETVMAKHFGETRNVPTDHIEEKKLAQMPKGCILEEYITEMGEYCRQARELAITKTNVSMTKEEYEFSGYKKAAEDTEDTYRYDIMTYADFNRRCGLGEFFPKGLHDIFGAEYIRPIPMMQIITEEGTRYYGAELLKNMKTRQIDRSAKKGEKNYEDFLVNLVVEDGPFKGCALIPIVISKTDKRIYGKNSDRYMGRLKNLKDDQTEEENENLDPARKMINNLDSSSFKIWKMEDGTYMFQIPYTAQSKKPCNYPEMEVVVGCDRNTKHNMMSFGTKAVYDPETGTYRDANIRDTYNINNEILRLCKKKENIEIIQEAIGNQIEYRNDNLIVTEKYIDFQEGIIELDKCVENKYLMKGLSGNEYNEYMLLDFISLCSRIFDRPDISPEPVKVITDALYPYMDKSRGRNMYRVYKDNIGVAFYKILEKELERQKDAKEITEKEYERRLNYIKAVLGTRNAIRKSVCNRTNSRLDQEYYDNLLNDKTLTQQQIDKITAEKEARIDHYRKELNAIAKGYVSTRNTIISFALHDVLGRNGLHCLAMEDLSVSNIKEMARVSTKDPVRMKKARDARDAGKFRGGNPDSYFRNNAKYFVDIEAETLQLSEEGKAFNLKANWQKNAIKSMKLDTIEKECRHICEKMDYQLVNVPSPYTSMVDSISGFLPDDLGKGTRKKDLRPRQEVFIRHDIDGNEIGTIDCDYNASCNIANIAANPRLRDSLLVKSKDKELSAYGGIYLSASQKSSKAIEKIYLEEKEYRKKTGDSEDEKESTTA